jgi:hypothetical protein
MGIGLADSRGDQFDQDLVISRFVEFEFLEDERLRGCFGYGGPNAHDRPLLWLRAGDRVAAVGGRYPACDRTGLDPRTARHGRCQRGACGFVGSLAAARMAVDVTKAPTAAHGRGRIRNPLSIDKDIICQTIYL